MQDNVNDFETGEGMTYKDVVDMYNDFVSGFSTTMFGNGIVNEIDEKILQNYLSDPDFYQKELEKITQYYYISDGDIFQILDMVKVLPSLNFKITSEDESDNYEKNIKKCNSTLKKIRHKILTRDIITQVTTAGTLVGVWLGDKKNPYFYVFNNLKQVFPSYRKNGRWIAYYDISYLEGLNELNREIVYQSLYPYITNSMYEAYLKDREKKYIELPEDRTVVIRTHTLFRNQRLGTGWATQSFKPVLHKKKLKDMEKNIANRIINGIFLLQLGNKDFPNSTLNKAAMKKVHSGIKTSLESTKEESSNVLTFPDWANLTVPEIKNSDTALGEEKFKSANSDISTASGISNTLITGNGGNYSSAKMNLEIYYKRIGVLLEEIEEIYNTLFNIILPAKNKDQYYLEFEKQMPITESEKVDLLMKLHNVEGFSLKSVIDEVPDLQFDEYVKQSIHEQEKLKLQEKIKPYASSYQGGADDDNLESNGGAPVVDNPTDSTIRGQEVDSNNIPE